MASNQKKSLGSLVLFAALCLLLLAFGCAPAYRVHSQLDVRAEDINDPGLISPDVKIYELTAGGIRELRDDWSGKGCTCLTTSIAETLKEKEVELETLIVDKDVEQEMDDIQALYRAVSLSIQLHTCGPHVFPEKKKNFDYSIGSIERILQKCGSDALIFVYGSDEISTVGRKALQAVAIVAGGLTGTVIIPRSGITSVSVALIEESGTILWYGMKSSEGGYDLRKPESASKLMKAVLSNFPRLGK